MTSQAYTLVRGEGPLVAVALHHGHDLSPRTETELAVDGATRLREEDPFTGRWTRLAPTRVVVHRSRFEVDLNRSARHAVYAGPEAAWGIDVWGGRRPPTAIVRSSRKLHREFYEMLGEILAEKGWAHGFFVLYDLHSYNHRRGGPDAPPDDPARNPEINLGTGNLDRRRWTPVALAFLKSAGRPRFGRRSLDVRENVRFEGGYLTRWVSERWPDIGCALAVEVKKTFMDEWTGRVDVEELDLLGRRLAATTPAVIAAARAVVSRSREPRS